MDSDRHNTDGNSGTTGESRRSSRTNSVHSHSDDEDDEDYPERYFANAIDAYIFRVVYDSYFEAGKPPKTFPKADVSTWFNEIKADGFDRWRQSMNDAIYRRCTVDEGRMCDFGIADCGVDYSRHNDKLPTELAAVAPSQKRFFTLMNGYARKYLLFWIAEHEQPMWCVCRGN